MASLKIVHVAETIIGGIASHLSEILPLQVGMLGTGQVFLLIPEEERQYIPPIAGVNVEVFPGGSNRLHSAWKLARALQTFRKRHRPDIVHAHSSFGGLGARLMGGAGSTPVVYCPHGWSFTQDKAEWKRRIYAIVERAQLRRTSFVVNVSHYEKAIAVRYAVGNDRKLAVIENGIARHAPKHLPAVPDLDPQLVHFAFVGRSERQKGLDLLIEAARQLVSDDIMFHLIGPSQSDDAPLLSDLPANMTVYGWRPRDFALSLIEKVDAIVIPSRSEGLPMIGIEAMRAGKAIIASNRAALPELVEHGRTGYLVDIDRGAELPETLRSLTRPELASLGLQARRRFEEKYIVDDQIAKFTTLYQASLAQ